MSIITENSNKAIKESPSEAANIAKKFAPIKKAPLKSCPRKSFSCKSQPIKSARFSTVFLACNGLI